MIPAYSTGQSVTGMWWSQCHRCPHHSLTRTRASAEAAAEIHEKTHEKTHEKEQP